MSRLIVPPYSLAELAGEIERVLGVPLAAVRLEPEWAIGPDSVTYEVSTACERLKAILLHAAFASEPEAVTRFDETFRPEAIKNAAPTMLVTVGSGKVAVPYVLLHEAAAEKLRLTTPKRTIYGLIGESAAMQQMLATMVRYAKAADTTVLITGETGTGKGLVARAIHKYSRRAKGPFIAINCGGITESLADSQLFGHAKGAFTGATQEHRGHFLSAHGGTLFLDEIGELPIGIQAKLLNALEDRVIQPVGSSVTKEVDIRLLAATHQDLQKKVANGEFRKDLYYRLKILSLPVPALRERRDDIPLLLGQFLSTPKDGLSIRVLDDELADHLCFTRYTFPGNVRELLNWSLELRTAADPGPVAMRDFEEFLSRVSNVPPARDDDRELLSTTEILPLREVLAVTERKAIENAYHATQGNISEMARLLNASRTFLRKMVRSYGLKPGPGGQEE